MGFHRKQCMFCLLAVIVCYSGNVSAQFEVIEECLDDDFFDEIISCFTKKFDDLLGAIELSSINNYDIDSANIGRKLQFSHADDALRKNYIPKVTEKMRQKHKAFVGPLVSAVNMAKRGVSHDTLKATLKNHNFKTLLGDYIHSLSAHLLPYTQKTGVLKRIFTEYEPVLQGQFINNIRQLTDPACIIFPELCELVEMAECLVEYEEESFEDTLDWLQCLYKCKELPALSMCVIDLFNQSDSCQEADWLGPIILRGFVDQVKLGYCYFEVEDMPENPLVLREGDEPSYVSFRTFMPPAILCLEPDMLDNPLGLILDIIGEIFGLSGTCSIQIQMSTSMWMHNLLPHDPLLLPAGRPKCRSDDVIIRQAAIGWFDQASEYSCIINITDSNWNQTFQVPIVATVDNKNDGNQNISLTLKMVKNDETYNTTKIPLTIVDRDASAVVTTCEIINDPHILTFDGHLYNNFYHGYFYLYKHETLPYEVQAIFQACSTSTDESCTCAVAIKSGDDVIVVDRCRKTPTSCTGDACQLLKFMIYKNGELSPGTRVIVRDEGLRYDVILPHGTIIRIISFGETLNAWIIPSTYDRDHTSGLCGTFNEDRSDDLTMPNGTVYNGDGSVSQGQPRPFNKAWKVPVEARIFNGLPEDTDASFAPMKYCKCHHILMEGVECTCGYDQLTEYCDIDIGDVLDDDSLAAIMRQSDFSSNSLEDDRDIDEDYEPVDAEWGDGPWTQATAASHCRKVIINSDNPVIDDCGVINNAFSSPYLNCIDDIKITNTTEWELAALESAKQRCRDRYSRRVRTLLEGDPSVTENGTCINECNNRGQCVLGVCECDGGYSGGDCSSSTAAAPVMVMTESSKCDSRYETCHFATVRGKNFRNTGDIKCVVEEFDVTIGEVHGSARRTEVDAIFINSDQVSCKLPTSGSFMISMTFQGANIASQFSDPSFVFMAHDSACYACNMQTNVCSRKEGTNDHCYIDDGCYAPEQVSSSDSCSVCNVTQATDRWTDKPNDACAEKRAEEKAAADEDKRNTTIRASVAAGLSGLIVIIAVVFFIIDRRSTKNKVKGDEDEMVHKASSGGDNHYVIAEPGQNHEALGHVNPVMAHTTEEDGVFITSFTNEPPASAEVMRIKAEVDDCRHRSDSVSSNHSISSFIRAKNLAVESRKQSGRISSIGDGSVKSLGLGGSGPTHLAHIHDTDTHGIGGRMSLGGTPSGKRKEYHGVPIARP